MDEFLRSDDDAVGAADTNGCAGSIDGFGSVVELE